MRRTKYSDPQPTRAESKNIYGMNSSTSGAFSEFIVCVDLMKRGYEVFRAVSPANSCDLIALKPGAMKRIEVRTGNYSKGKISFAKKIEDEGRSDHYAVVVEDRVAFYKPLLQQ